MESPSIGLHSRPTTGRNVEEGRLGGPCGPGAHLRASQKINLRLRRHASHFIQGGSSLTKNTGMFQVALFPTAQGPARSCCG